MPMNSIPPHTLSYFDFYTCAMLNSLGSLKSIGLF